MIRRSYLLALCLAIFALQLSRAQAPTAPLSIVLPPRLLANAPATLAILGPDGHLAAGVAVDIGNGEHVTTDATGRASFTAPPDGALIASAQGLSAASLVDAALPSTSAGLTIAPNVSQHDRFAICGGRFSGDVSADSVTINGDAAFVLAVSPVCAMILPQTRTLAGPARVDIDSAGTHAAGATALVALDFLPPNPPLLPGRKGKLIVRAEGTSDSLEIAVENHSSHVIHFVRGELQELRTSGGARNQAVVEVQAIRSGDFSFRARILSPPDTAAAARYLEIAEGAASKSANRLGREIQAIAAQLSRHPREPAKSRAAIERLANATPSGSLRALLDAAAQSLE